MSLNDSDFTIGVEEEYLLVDKDSLDLAALPEALMQACRHELGDQVSPEFLNCQIEVGTKVCRNLAEARAELQHLRSTVARLAAQHNLAPIAASCHPFSDWRNQAHTNKDRYNDLQENLAGVVRRLLICGMHVHVGIKQPDRRIDLINQLKYFLPHFLALSTSSPFWQGEDTGLSSYRLTVFDNLPRTGLPPQLDGWGSFERSVTALTDLGVIEDASKIWWDLRPSSNFPTIETRICDVSPRLETTLTLAALIQTTTRMLCRLAQNNQRWRIYDNFLIAENRWRAQRYGVQQGLIDFGARKIVPMQDLIEEMLGLIRQDAEALDAISEVNHARDIVKSGSSADQQRAVFQDALHAGYDQRDALKAVVRHLTEEYHADL